MRLLVSDKPVEPVAAALRRGDADAVWHVRDDAAAQLRAWGFDVLCTADVLPPGGAAALRQEAVDWIDALAEGSAPGVSLRQLAACGPYSLWQSVRQSIYSNFRSRVRLDRLLRAVACLQVIRERRPGITEIQPDLTDPAIIEAIRQVVRAGRLRMPRRAALAAWMAVRGDVVRQLRTEALRCAKELIVALLAARRRCVWQADPPFAVTISYAPLVTPQGASGDVTGVSRLRDQLRERGLAPLNVVIDYSRRLDRDLLRSRSENVALEVFLTLSGVARASRVALRMLRRWPALRREWRRRGALVYHGVDLGASVRWQLAYYACVFVPKSALYVEAFAKLYATGPQYALMIGEYSRLGQCAIIAARRAGVTFCGIQHGRVHADHPAYLPPAAPQRLAHPLPDVFFAFGERDRTFLSTSFPDLGAVTRVVGYLNHDRLFEWLARDPASLRATLGIPPTPLVVSVFDNDNDPAALREIVDDLDALTRTGDIWAIVHPHPRTVHPESFFRGLLRDRSSRVRYTAGEDSYLVMAVTDVFLVPSGASTTLGEAAAAGCHAMFAAWHGDETVSDAQQDVATPLRTRAQLTTEVLALERAGFRRDLRHAGAAARQAFLVDGCVAGRMVDALVQSSDAGACRAGGDAGR